MVVPIGITTLAIESGIPIFLAASRLAGIVARLLQVLMAVNEGTILFFQKSLMPLVPLATKAYKLKNTKK